MKEQFLFEALCWDSLNLPSALCYIWKEEDPFSLRHCVQRAGGEQAERISFNYSMTSIQIQRIVLGVVK